MKEIRYLLIMAICAIGLAACQDEDWAGIRQGVNTDKPVKVELKFGVPRSPEISVSRADNSVSGIYGIRLYIFDESGRFLNTPDDIMSEDEGGTLKMGSTTDPDQGQYYTATTTLYEGKQHVYAVANITRTGFVNNSTAFLNSLAEAAAEGEDSFKAAYYLLSESISGDNAFPPVTTDCIPLSGFGEITVNSSTDIQGRIDLKRWVAQLKFRINTNTYEKENGNKITFTPSSYTIYNIPKRGYVLDGENQETIEGSDYFYNSATIDFPGASQTGDDKGYVVVDEGIYVPENIQTAKKTCENCPANLSKDDIIRGYEYEPGKYVTLTDAELEKIKSPKDKSMNIDAFVSLDEIDPILYQKSYYLAPQGGDKAFNLFAKALEEQKKVAIAKTVLGTNEQVIAIRSINGKLILSTLYFYDEVQASPVKDNVKEVSASELKLAKTPIDNMTQKFDASKYKNEYREKVEKAIKIKINGEKITANKDKPRRSNVINLMDALKQSVESSKKVKLAK